MSFTSTKTLVLAMSLLAVVACGKNKHDINIDGAYELENTDTAAKKPQIFVNVKDNIATTYILSADQKSAEIDKKEWIVRGTKLVGTEPVEKDACDGDVEVADSNSAELKKVKGGLMLLGTDAEGNSGVVMSLKNISDDKMAEIEKLEQVCLNADGVAVKKVKGTILEDIIENIAIEDKNVGEKTEEKIEAKTDEKIEDKKDTTINESTTATIQDVETAAEDKM